jgi:hypothetical protein
MAESLELVFRVQTEGQQQLDAVQRAIKGISGEVRQGGQQLAQFDGGLRKITETAGRANQSLSGFGNDILGKLTRPLGAAGNAVEGLAGRLGTVGVASAAAVVAIGFVGKKAFDLVAEMGAAARQTEQLAERLGIASGSAAQLEGTAKLAGISIGAMEGAAAKLQTTLAQSDAAGAKAAAALRALGVATHEANGAQREGGAVLTELLGKLGAVQNASERYRIAQDALGREGARSLKPVIEDYDQLQRTVRALGVGVDESLTRNLAEARGRIDELSLAWEQFKTSIAGRLAKVALEIDLIPSVAGKAASAEDLARMGITLPARFQSLSPAGARQAAAQAGFFGFGPANAPSGNPVLSSLLDPNSTINRNAAADAFRTSFGQTEAGRRQRLGVVRGELGELSTALSSSDLSAATRADFQTRFEALTREEAAIEAKLKNAKETLNRTGQEFDRLIQSLQENGLDPLARLLTNTEARLQEVVARQGALTPEQAAQATGALQGAIRRQAGRNAPVSSAVDLGTTGFQFGGLRTLPVSAEVDPRNAEATIAQFQERRVRALQQYTNFQEQITRLTAGPGGEMAAIERIAVLREDAAQREFAITRDRARLEEQLDMARKERVLSILELQRKQLEDYRQTAGQVYDALTQRGGGGLRDFFRGQANILQRQLFVNASAGIFQRFGSTLGRVGAASGLGGLLSGTIFDPKIAETATAANTTATERNTIALERNTAATAGGGIAGQIPGLTGSTGLSVPGLIRSATPGAGSGGLLGNIFAGLSSPLTAGLFRGFQGGDYSIATGNGTATSASALGLTSTGARVANIGASAAIVAGGTAGILSGLRQGGARGTATAVASGLGVASTIPGPQQPFLQAAALVAGLVTGLFPDAKKQREDEIGRTLQGSRYTDALGVDRFTDQYGRDLDYNRRGDLRVVQPVTVNVQAMDAKGFLDRAEDIGNAVKAALQGGHDVADSMRGLVFVR